MSLTRKCSTKNSLFKVLILLTTYDTAGLKKASNKVLHSFTSLKTVHVYFQFNGAVDQVVIDAEGIGLGLVDVSTWLFTHNGIKGTMSVIHTKTD